MVTCLISACDLWPKQLEPLAESISEQVSGDTTALLLGGDVVVIDVAGSPSYQIAEAELEILATGIAEQAIESTARPLESIAVTFYEDQVTGDSEKMREFIFVVMNGRPVLQPYAGANATGPLTDPEIQAAVERMDRSSDSLGRSLTREHKDCVLSEMQRRARDAGDPGTLDPATVEYLTSETWGLLDASAKRIFLAQALLSDSLFTCAGRLRKSGLNSGE
jgi:hypothetical protein